MSLAIGIPLLLLEAIAQSAVVNHWRLFGGTLDLVLVTVLCWNLVAERADGLAWAFVGGLFADLLSAGPIGASAVGLLTVGYLAHRSTDRLWRVEFLAPPAIAVVGTILYHLIYLMLLTISGYPARWGDLLAYVTLPSAVLNLAGILPLYYVLRALHRRLRGKVKAA